MLWSARCECAAESMDVPEPQTHRFCFALAMFHLILAASLIGVQSTKDKRAALQNG